MYHLKLLMLEIDSRQEIVKREQFHKAIEQLKLFPEYYKITLNIFK